MYLFVFLVISSQFLYLFWAVFDRWPLKIAHHAGLYKVHHSLAAMSALHTFGRKAHSMYFWFISLATCFYSRSFYIVVSQMETNTWIVKNLLILERRPFNTFDAGERRYKFSLSRYTNHFRFNAFDRQIRKFALLLRFSLKVNLANQKIHSTEQTSFIYEMPHVFLHLYPFFLRSVNVCEWGTVLSSRWDYEISGTRNSI